MADQHLPSTTRGLRHIAAAAYIGVSKSKFDELVKDGRMPSPLRIDGCVIWDVRHLDLAFDALSDESEAEDTWTGI